MRHRRVWLQLSGAQREAVVRPLTLNCPFCETPLGSLAGGDFAFGGTCDCGAGVVRVQDGTAWSSPPGTMAQAFRELRKAMRVTVVGHDHAVDRLALLGARHLHIGGRQRALLVGPSGTGKTTMGAALAQALGCPMMVWDVGASSEVGWAGIDASQVMAELYELCDHDVARMARSVLVWDEVDKLAVRDATGTAKQHRLGQQKSLLTLLGGGIPLRFPIDGDRGRSVAVSTDGMLILGMGSFQGMTEEGVVGPDHLVRYGLSTEFASRFPILIRLGRLDRPVLLSILERAAAEATRAAREFGVDVRVSEAALRYVATAVERGGQSVTPRAGVGWLQAAVDQVLLRRLAEPTTMAYTVGPDDVTVPRSLRRQ